jgi:hypothetical protein
MGRQARSKDEVTMSTHQRNTSAEENGRSEWRVWKDASKNSETARTKGNQHFLLNSWKRSTTPLTEKLK